jgi:hypothetical protein
VPSHECRVRVIDRFRSLQGITDSFKDAVDSVSDSVKVREPFFALHCWWKKGQAQPCTVCHCTFVAIFGICAFSGVMSSAT